MVLAKWTALLCPSRFNDEDPLIVIKQFFFKVLKSRFIDVRDGEATSGNFETL